MGKGKGGEEISLIVERSEMPGLNHESGHFYLFTASATRVRTEMGHSEDLIAQWPYRDV